MRRTYEGMAGWPLSHSIKGGGTHITGRYMHPRLARELPAGALVFGTLVGMFLLVVTGNVILPLGFALLLWLFFNRWCHLMTRIYGKKVNMKIYADRVEIKTGRRYEKFSRAVSMQFSVEPHEKGAQEIAWEAEGWNAKKLYRNANEVVMYWGENRIQIAEFRNMDQQLATALVMRIQSTMQETGPKAFEKMFGKPMPVAKTDFGPEPNLP